MSNNIIIVLNNYGIMQKSNKCKLPNIFFHLCVDWKANENIILSV